MATKFKQDDWKKLSVKEKIGQTFIHMPNPEAEIRQYGNLKKFLEENPIGGMFSLNREGENYAKNLLERYKEYLEACPIPLFHIDDMESGAGCNIKDLTHLPHIMSLGATNSEELAYNYGKATAIEARCAGVSWAFTPVVDLPLNPINPMTNHRSVSDDPEMVVRLVSQIIKGMQDNGVAATLKHFPGDGVDFRDQHLVTSCNGLTMEKWWKYSGRAFQGCIDAGVYSIMPGHISLPAYQKETKDGLYLPATLSKELLTNLLKKEMGFKGVIVSDALVMSGFKGYYADEQADIEAFKAGCDVMLWTTPNYMENMIKAVESGEVSMERLDDAVERIWNLKMKVGLFDEDFEPGTPLTREISGFAQQTAQKTAEESITLLRDKKNQLPLKPDVHKKILLVGVATLQKNFEPFNLLKKELEKRGAEVTLQKNLRFETDLQYQDTVSDQYDLIIFAINRYPHHPIGPQSFFGDEAESIWSVNSIDRNKTMVISFGNPFFFNEYFEAVHVYINAYSYVPATLEATAKALYGEIPFKGKSPVNLSLEKIKTAVELNK
ncbi:MAG: glycoside hydrolase family 3 protein [Bacteroidota bacterium]